MHKFTSKLLNILFFICFFIFIINIIFIGYGFYYTGDTISFLENTNWNNPLTIFMHHLSSWTPLTSIFFYMFRFVSPNYVLQQKAYVLFFLSLNFIFYFLLIKNICLKNGLTFIITIFCIFFGLQSALFHAALSEIIFMAFWPAALLFIYRYLITNDEKYLFLFLFPGSLLALSRYLGIPVLFSLCAILFIYIFILNKNKIKSKYLALTVITLVWMPILFYLFKNNLQGNSFLGFRDEWVTAPLFERLISGMIIKTIKECYLWMLLAIMIGSIVKWNRHVRILLIITSISLFGYYFGAAFGHHIYRVAEAFPSRYTAVSFPILLICMVMLGAFISSKIFLIKYKQYLLIIVLISSLYVAYKSYSDFRLELNTKNSLMEEVMFSKDIQRFCNVKTKEKRYLLIQASSRNWIGQSLAYFCKPIDLIPETASVFTIPKGSYLYTPYDLDDKAFEKVVNYSMPEVKKIVYKYLVKHNIEIPVKAMFLKLKLID